MEAIPHPFSAGKGHFNAHDEVEDGRGARPLHPIFDVSDVELRSSGAFETIADALMRILVS